MKHITTIGLALLLLAGSAAADSTLELGEADGFSETVQVSDYDEEKGTVRLIASAEIEEKPLSEFSEAVQQKILCWYADDVFYSSSGLRIRTKEEEGEREFKDGEITYIKYIITLENRSEVPLNGVKLACRVFLDQWNAKTEDDDLYVYTEVAFSADLPPGGKKIFKTKEFPVRDYINKKEILDGHRSIPVEDKLLGMLLTVEKKSFEGKTLTRTEKEGRPPEEEKAEKYIYKKRL